MTATVSKDGTIRSDGAVLLHMLGPVLPPGTRVSVVRATHLGHVRIVHDDKGNTARYAPRAPR
jgi:hypothetical protein